MRANGHGFSRRKGVLITGSPDSAAPLIILPKSIRHPSLAVSGSALRPGSREFAERWFSSSFLFLSFLSGGKCPDVAVYLSLLHQPRCRQEGTALVSASRLLPTWKVNSLWHLLQGVIMLPPACHPVPPPTRRLSSAPKGVTGMKQEAKQPLAVPWRGGPGPHSPQQAGRKDIAQFRQGWGTGGGNTHRSVQRRPRRFDLLRPLPSLYADFLPSPAGR